MKKDFSNPYFQRLIFNLFIKLISDLPIKILLFLGKIGGLFFYHSNKKFKALRNLRIAFAPEKSPFEIRKILRKSCMNFGMNIFEILKLPKIDKTYLKKYLRYKNLELLKKYQDTSIVIMGIHFGNWELANSKIAQDFKYVIFVRPQKPKFWDEFLNSQRRKFGLEIIEESMNFLKRIKECIREKKFLGFVADHGVSDRSPKIEFFKRKVASPIGGVKICQKYNLPLILAFTRREKQNFHLIEIYKEISLTGDVIKDLEKVNKTLEEYIKIYPYEYNWYFKRFKFTSDRYLLFITDSKPGHKKQLESFLNIVKESEFEIVPKFVNIKFKSKFRRILLDFLVLIFYKIAPSLLIYFLKFCLEDSSFKELFDFSPDFVISCGAQTQAANLIVSLENNAKNISILKPSGFPFNWFYKIFLPYHDKVSRKNVINFWGALSFFDKNSISESVEKLKREFNIREGEKICVFLGGRSKNFYFDKEFVISFLKKLIRLCEKRKIKLLLTTSRRTPFEIEEVLEKEFKDEFEVLVLANKRNYPFITEGFLGLSKKVIVTSDSISMVSEALSLKKEVYVLDLPSKKHSKHSEFLESLLKENFILKINLDNIEEIFNQNTFNKRFNEHLKEAILDSIR